MVDFGFAVILATLFTLAVVGHATSVLHQSESFYKIQNSVSFLSPPTYESTHHVVSLLACSSICSRSSNCKEFYIENTTVLTLDNRPRLVCNLIAIPTSKNNCVQGDGIHGLDITPPILNDVISPVVSFDYKGKGLAAVYDCSSLTQYMTTAIILFNHQENRWPSLNKTCSDTLCQQTGLAGTALRISSSSVGYTFSVQCESDERRLGDAYCSTEGVWTYEAVQKAGCVSPTCYRMNNEERGLYIGTKAVSETGSTCQRWDAQSPHSHTKYGYQFWLDNDSVSNAENFCRDPSSGVKKPWCYQLVGIRWTFCDIPLC